MGKKGKLYIAIIVATILAIVYLEMTKPKEINWFPSYATHHKIPFGTYIFNEQLQRISDKITEVSSPPFEYLYDNDVEGTYVFVNNNIAFGEDELNTLLDWTAQGNTLFIASDYFEETLLDTLGLDIKSVNTFDNFDLKFDVKLVNPNLLKHDTTYSFDKADVLYYFNEIDTLQTKAVGLLNHHQSNADSTQNEMINIIRQPFGDGKIILSTFPQAFTNYFILKDDGKNYTANLISYLDTNQNIYIDNYYKSGKTFYSSPMYLFLNTTSLKWAYYMVLIGVLLYIIFEGKRKQRAIPIIKPLKNQTLDFTRTIANMYFESEKHKDIAQHKIQHFLDYIRLKLHLPTSEINDEFISNLASRSNNSTEDTEALFNHIELIGKQTSISASNLETLNSLIETFKSRNQWKTTI